MFIPLKMVLIGIDPSPQFIIEKTHHWSSHWSRGQNRSSQRALGAEEAHGGSSVSHTWSDFLHGKAGGMPTTGNMWLCVCVIYIYICLKWKGGAHTLPTNNLLQTHHWKKITRLPICTRHFLYPTVLPFFLFQIWVWVRNLYPCYPYISIIKSIAKKRTIHDDHLVSPTL